MFWIKKLALLVGLLVVGVLLLSACGADEPTPAADAEAKAEAEAADAAASAVEEPEAASEPSSPPALSLTVKVQTPVLSSPSKVDRRSRPDSYTPSRYR